MQLWFMTGNQGKLLEARHTFLPFGFNVEQLIIKSEVPNIIEPQCETLEEVANAKISQGIELLKSIGKARIGVSKRERSLSTYRGTTVSAALA